MSAQEKETLKTILAVVQKSVTEAKKALDNGSISAFYEHLKSTHNTVTKAKNTTVDFALAYMDVE